MFGVRLTIDGFEVGPKVQQAASLLNGFVELNRLAACFSWKAPLDYLVYA